MAKVEVNKQAPDFTLADFEGNPFQLSSYRGQKNILLILNRGLICPFCQRHMMQLHQEIEEFDKRNTLIVTVGPENANSFIKYWSKHELAFYGVPDEEHIVAELYGQEVKVLKLGRLPAQMIIDKNGILRYVHYGRDMEDIPSNQEILSFIDDLDKEASM